MIRRLVILLLLFVAAWGSTLVGQERYAVTANTLNVRSGPGTYYSVVYKLHKGDVVEVIGQNGQWATIRGAGGRYYVNSRYLSYVGPVQKQKSPAPKKESGWDKLYRVVKVILEILAIVAAIGLFVSNAISGLALWMLIICGIGALVGWMFFDNGTAGAVVTMGLEILVGGYIIYKSTSNPYSSRWANASGLFYWIWFVVSFPFFMLNWLQFWLSKPWRPLMKYNTIPDSAKPGMRTFLGILQIPFYILVTPLRFINAVYYNIGLYNLYAWSNYIVEVFVPSDNTEGALDFVDWLYYLPKRVIKYLLWHGSLTTIESVIWTVIDTIFPAMTLFHGTAVEYADSMLCDPHRNKHRERTSGWKSGIWNVGGGNYAGSGIYFGISRKTLINYQKGAAIAARVTPGKTIDTVLMPDYIYRSAGAKGGIPVSNWGLNNGYVTGEWWREDGEWWEICLYDRQNKYNESWRIRPIYAIYIHNGIMQRIPGGPAHWLFRKQVIDDLLDTLSK